MKYLARLGIERAPFDCVIELPNECPHCHCKLLPQVLSENLASAFEEEDIKLGFLLYCESCHNTFIAQYIVDKDSKRESVNYETGFCTTIDFIAPLKYSCCQFDEKISKISPRFVSIYNQAEQARLEGLDEICGMGFRKSLEVLIKDFSIHIHPNGNHEQLKNQHLYEFFHEGNTFTIENKKLLTLAKSATWIGNDFSHYCKKHDFEVEKLKSFINASILFILQELEYEDALELQNK